MSTKQRLDDASASLARNGVIGADGLRDLLQTARLEIIGLDTQLALAPRQLFRAHKEIESLRQDMFQAKVRAPEPGDA